jgi:hypothetical protein
MFRAALLLLALLGGGGAQSAEPFYKKMTLEETLQDKDADLFEACVAAFGAESFEDVDSV